MRTSGYVMCDDECGLNGDCCGDTQCYDCHDYFEADDSSPEVYCETCGYEHIPFPSSDEDDFDGDWLNDALQADYDENNVLAEAYDLVNGPRARDYAHPRVNFERIAKLWSVVFDQDVTKTQVALAMMLLKIARHAATPKRDNMVDIAGYAYALELATFGDFGEDQE